MRKWLWGIWLACVAVILILVVRHRPRETSVPPDSLGDPAAAPAGRAGNSAATSPANLSAPAVTPGGAAVWNLTPATNGAGALNVKPALPMRLGEEKTPDVSPRTIVENMRSAIRSYGAMFGGNPVGTNPEITKALDGDNPKQAHFLRAEDGLRINGNGELIDAWGTPFFFHQLSAAETEIHSAGPDKIMWTADDLVIK